MLRRSPSPGQVFIFVLCTLAVIWSCRAGDVISSWQKGNPVAGTAAVSQGTQSQGTTTPTGEPPVRPSATSSVAPPTETEEPTETPEPGETSEPTGEPSVRPSATAVATATSTVTPPTGEPPVRPSATAVVAPPTPLTTETSTLPDETSSPTEPSTPELTPTPTRCPYKYCVKLVDCWPGNNTRAIGTVYENGVPKSGVRVRVSYSDGGPPVVDDFITGRNPISPNFSDPNHPGYYQIGIREGSAYDGNWWVFLIDEKERQISEGRFFKTTDVVTSSSCQVGITDFSK